MELLIIVVCISAVLIIINMAMQSNRDTNALRKINEVNKKEGKPPMTMGDLIEFRNLDYTNIVEVNKYRVKNGLPELTNEEVIEVQNMTNIMKNTLKCPKCGSTAITTGNRGWKATTGFIGSSKTVNRCGNCGYTWTPKG